MLTNKLKIFNYTVMRQSRYYISALYVTGDKANENYAVLEPFMDFELKLKNSNLERNLNWRNININVQDIKRKYEEFKNMKLEIHQLENRRQEIAKALRELEVKNVENENNLKEKGKSVRDKLKSIKRQLYPLEDDFVTKFLTLPNDLSDRTPRDHAHLLYRKNPPENIQTKTNPKKHLDHKDLISFTGKSTYYLFSDAALYDLEFPNSCINHLLNHNFTLTVNPDFGRSVLLEAALVDKALIHTVLEEVTQNKLNLLHLAGGGSLTSFLGYIAKLSVFPNTIPLRLVSVGRNYSKVEKNTLEGLYATNQTNKVQAFIASETTDQADQEIDSILNIIVDIYKKLDINFRIEFLPAPLLAKAESLRASIQIYSPVYSQYIEVGHISHYRDFISKRLLFNLRKNKDIIFPSIVAGTIADVTKIIACLLENEKKLQVPCYERNTIKSFEKLLS